MIDGKPILALVLLLILSHVAVSAELFPPVVSVLVIDASAGEIWNAWTQREKIEAWMVNSSSGLDLSIGGQWVTSYDDNLSLNAHIDR